MGQRIIEQYTPQRLADDFGGELSHGSGKGSLGCVTTEVRDLGHGETFFLLPGRDVFLARVIERSPRAIVASKGVIPPGALPTSISLVEFESSETALLQLARQIIDGQRRRNRFTCFAIAGVNGKTTTANLLSAVLEARLKILQVPAEESQTVVGLASVLVNLEKDQNIGVVELPLSPKGHLLEIAEWLRPEARVITNVGPAFLDEYGSSGVVMEELMRFLEIPGCSRVVIERDLLPWIPPLTKDCHVKTIGTDFASSILLQSVLKLPQAIMLTLRMTNDARLQLRVPIMGLHNAYNTALVVAAVDDIGLTPSAIAKGLENFRAPSGYFRRYIVASGAELVHDEDNHNIASMRAALMYLHDLCEPEERVIALGEMPGLGMGHDILHRRLGACAASLQPKLLVCLGGRGAEMIAEGAVKAGLPEGKVRVAIPRQARLLATAIKHRSDRRDYILLKGAETDSLLDALESSPIRNF